MKKLVLGSLLGLAFIGVRPASAQLFGPVINPFGSNLNPYASPYGTFGPGLGGGFPGFGYPGYGTGFGYPGMGYPGYGPQGYGMTGGFVPGVTGVAGASGYAPPTPVNLGTPAITGHPTRFFNYAQFFFNQGGTTVATGVPQILGVNPGQAPQSAIAVEGTGRGKGGAGGGGGTGR